MKRGASRSKASAEENIGQSDIAPEQPLEGDKADESRTRQFPKAVPQSPPRRALRRLAMAAGNRRPSAISIAPTWSRPSPTSITGLIFDGQTLRIEFGVTRFDDVKPNTADHRPSLSRLPPGAAAGRGGRSHQPHAADRGGADASRRGQADAAPGAEAAEGGDDVTPHREAIQSRSANSRLLLTLSWIPLSRRRA